MLLQVVTLHVFHDQKGGVAIPVRVVHADDIRVLQPRRRAGLGAKAHFVIGRFFTGQVLDLDGLDGHLAVQIGVAGLIDHTHSAFAQHADDVVTT